MKKEFKRKSIFPIIFMLPALLFGFTTILQFATGNPVALITMIASILFFVNSIWSLSTPLIRLDQYQLSIKEGLFKQKSVLVSDIKKIEMRDGKKLEVYRNNGSVVKMRLDALRNSDKADLKNALSRFEKE